MADAPAARAVPAAPAREVLRSAFAHPCLRRVAAVFACFKCAEMGTWIVVTTVAHHLGGVRLATVAVVAQLLPAAVAALGVDAASRRFGASRVLAGGLLVQTVALAALAVVVAVNPTVVAVIAVAVVAAVAVVTTRPILHTVAPRLLAEPGQLLAVNSVLGWIEGGATLAGPLVTAVGLAVFGWPAPFLAFAVMVAVAAVVACTGLGPVLSAPGGPWAPDVVPGPAGPGPGRTTSRRERALVLALAAQALLVGALDILVVVVAVDIASGGPASAAWLSAAFGAGGLVGALVVMARAGLHHLAAVAAVGGVAAALALASVGLTRSPWAAAAILAACGLASGATLVAARTMLQQVCGEHALRRVLSVAESAEMAMLLVGSLAVPLVGPSWSPAVIAVMVLAVAAGTVLAGAQPASGNDDA